MNIDNTQRGITLVAIVVTIIVLLIVAGVVINLSINEGILSRAEDAKKVQIKEEMKEKLSLKLLDLNAEKEGNATLDDITQEWAEIEMEGYNIEVQEDKSMLAKKIKIEKNNIIEMYIINQNFQVINEEAVGRITFEKLSSYGREVTLKIDVQNITYDDIEKYLIYRDEELVYEGTDNIKKIDKLEFNTDYIFKGKVVDKNGNIIETEDMKITTEMDDVVYYNGQYRFINNFSDFNTSSAATDFRYGSNCEVTKNGITAYWLRAININISNMTYSGINTSEKVDLTNVNSIEFDLKLLNNYTSSSAYETVTYYGISDTKTEDYSNYVEYGTVTSNICDKETADCMTNGEAKNERLDVSKYNGEYYIKIVVVHPAIKNYEYSTIINKITLK